MGGADEADEVMGANALVDEADEVVEADII